MARSPRSWQVLPTCALHDRPDIHETHQALLAEVRLTGQPIPVVEFDGSKPLRSYDTCIAVRLEHGRFVQAWVIKKDGPDSAGMRCFDEPWAQGLAPGDLLAPVDVTMLATQAPPGHGLTVTDPIQVPDPDLTPGGAPDGT